MNEADINAAKRQKQQQLWVTRGSASKQLTTEADKADECCSIEENRYPQEQRQQQEGTPFVADEGLPLWVSIPVAFSYLAIVALVVSLFDWPDPRTGNTDPGLTFGEAFYFAFISVTTIGFGDVMPNNIQFSPTLAPLFLVGLALLSVVNSTIYMRIESRFVSSINYLEEYIEEVHFYYRRSGDGYFVFKCLAPNIKLLALALPIFPESKDDQIETILEPTNTALGHRLFTLNKSSSSLLLPPSRRSTRTYSASCNDSEDNSWMDQKKHRQVYHTVHGNANAQQLFRPTLGILNTAPPSRRGTIVENRAKRNDSLKVCSAMPTPTCRKRAVTIGHLEMDGDDNGGGGTNKCQTTFWRRTKSQLMKRRKSTKALVRTLTMGSMVRKKRQAKGWPAADSSRQLETVTVETDKGAEETASAEAEEKEERQFPGRNVYQKKAMGRVGAAETGPVDGDDGSIRCSIRRSHSERVVRISTPHALYVIDECESHNPAGEEHRRRRGAHGRNPPSRNDRIASPSPLRMHHLQRLQFI